MTATETLASVTPLRPRVSEQPRYLSYRAHPTRPPAVQPFAVVEYGIEQTLADLWDRRESPYTVLTMFAPAVQVEAREALDVLFDAADAVADCEMRGEPGWAALLDAHCDALDMLRRILRGQQ